MTSAEAEARIKERGAEHLAGQCFITTDEHEEAYGSGCKLYVNSCRTGDVIDQALLSHWVRTMTRDSFADGVRQPAPFRRFHVKGARKAQAQLVEALAA